jgi:hypothetical protein
MKSGGYAALFCFFCVALSSAQDASVQDSPPQHLPPQHLVQDWSSRHVVFSGLTPETLDDAVAADPRAWHSWLNHARYNFQSPVESNSEPNPDSARRRHKKSLRRDWQMNLGSGSSVGPRTFPAKFSFNINAPPDCINDYVVFGTSNSVFTGHLGGAASIVAFNNLYTGPGPTGICPTPAAPASQPSVLFSYNTASVPIGLSSANLSPVLSLDGTKIGFVENNTGSGNNYTAFHVLTWKAGEGTLSSSALPGNCAAGNSCLTTLVLSTSSSDRRSSPFVDYSHDTAYVGDGALLHKITPVFGGTPKDTVGGGWPVALVSTGSPVYDSVSGRVFVVATVAGTNSLVVLNAATGATISSTALTALTASDLIVDSTNQTVFVFFTAIPGFALTVDQFDTSGTLLTHLVAGHVAGNVSIFTGTFDHNYFSNPSTGRLYFAGAINGIGSLYGVGFTGKFMDTTFSGPLALSTSATTSIPTPLTSIYNPTLTGSPDRLFVGLDENCASASTLGCMEGLNISSGFPSGVLNQLTIPLSGSLLDVSGIIIDNVSASAQASSIYFDGAGVAFKLTQSALQ